MMSTKDKIEKLNEYTKAEIITALVRTFHGTDINRLILHLEAEQMKKVMTEQEKADAAETEALNALLEWRSMIVKKYGDGERVALIKVPQDEIMHGAALEKAYADAQKRAAALDVKIKKLVGI